MEVIVLTSSGEFSQPHSDNFGNFMHLHSTLFLCFLRYHGLLYWFIICVIVSCIMHILYECSSLPTISLCAVVVSTTNFGSFKQLKVCFSLFPFFNYFVLTLPCLQ
jgi:hypothetical protein